VAGIKQYPILRSGDRAIGATWHGRRTKGADAAKHRPCIQPIIYYRKYVSTRWGGSATGAEKKENSTDVRNEQGSA